MHSLRSDLRFATRALLRTPAFSVTVVLTLAIGIGAAISVFAVLEAALLRPLPYADAGRLVVGRTTFGTSTNWTSSAQDYDDLRQQVRSFSSLGATTGFVIGATVSGLDEPTRARQSMASSNLFATLGVDPVLGRHFTAEEAVVGGPDVVILSHDFWRGHLRADPEIVGETLRVDGGAATIVGVMPAGFRLLYDADLWKPLRMGGSYAGARRFHNWVMIGRLGPEAHLAEAQQEAESIGARLEVAYPDSNDGKSFRFDPLRDVLTETSRSQLGLLVAAVALLLVISSGNVAGLLLVRGAGRRQELAIRAALGAPRRRLMSQLLTEGVLLALAAGVVGLIAAQLSASALLRLLPLDALGIERLSVNPSVAVFALLLSVVTAGLFTLAPSLRASRLHPGRELTGSRSTDSRGTARIRAGLVVAQIALTVVLLAGAGLLARSLAGLQADDLGFDSRDLVTAEIQLSRGERSEEEARVFFGLLLDRTRGLTGIDAAALISQLPVRDPGNNISVQRAEDFDPSRPGSGPLAYIRSVYPGYFATLGIPFVSGRDVDATDAAGDPLVAVINRRLAQVLFEDEDAVGREIAIDAGDGAVATVIGIVGNVKINGPGSDDEPVFYFPARQWTTATMRLAMRTAGSGSAIGEALRSLLGELDPEIPLDRLETMRSVVSSRLGQRRVTTAALVLFAVAALTLAAIGLYGVLAEGVLQRRREIGVRLALGAARQRVVGLVVGQAALMVGGGLAIGLLATLSLSRIVADILYEVSPYDPLTLALVTLILGGFAVLAVALPAARASRIDPAIALRDD